MKKVVLKASIFIFMLFTIALLLPKDAISGKTIVLKYANFPPAKTFPCVQMERWAKEVEKLTRGRVKIETYPGGTLLGAKQMFDGIVTGIADIGCLCMPYQPGRFPLLEGIDTPVGFPNTTVASLVLWDLYEKYKPKELSKVKVLTLFTCAPGQIMSKIPIKRLADLKGVEIRTTGATKAFMDKLGAIPVAMPMSDVPEALQKGVIKGLVSSVEVLMDFKFAEYCRYVTILNGPTASFAVVMNMKKWNSLPEDVKGIMELLAREQAKWTGQYVDNHCKEALEWSIKNYGLKVFHLPKDEMAKVMELTRPLVEAYIKRAMKRGLPAKEFMDDVMSLKEAYSRLY